MGLVIGAHTHTHTIVMGHSRTNLESVSVDVKKKVFITQSYANESLPQKYNHEGNFQPKEALLG